MFLIALLALALIGTTVTLLAKAGALPRVRAAQRLDDIAAYGAPAGSISGEETPRHVVFEGVASQLGTIVARRIGADEDDLRRHLMAAGVYRLSPIALLGYRSLATLLLPFLALLAAPEPWPLPARIGLA